MKGERLIELDTIIDKKSIIGKTVLLFIEDKYSKKEIIDTVEKIEGKKFQLKINKGVLFHLKDGTRSDQSKYRNNTYHNKCYLLNEEDAIRTRSLIAKQKEEKEKNEYKKLISQQILKCNRLSLQDLKEVYLLVL